MVRSRVAAVDGGLRSHHEPCSTPVNPAQSECTAQCTNNSMGSGGGPQSPSVGGRPSRRVALHTFKLLGGAIGAGDERQS